MSQAENAAAPKRYCRCQLDRKTFWAVEEGEQVAELSRAPWQGGERTSKTFPRSEVR